MFDLSSLNQSRGRRHHGRTRHRRNRAEGGSSFRGAGGPATVGHYLARKGAETLVGGAFGYMEGYSGEPVFFQTKGDPTSGIGLKALTALMSNGAELAQLFTGWSFKSVTKGMPELGTMLDGAVEGTASASWVAYIFTQGNTYGAGKRAKEKAAGTAGVDYAKAKRLAPDTRVRPEAAPEAPPAAVTHAARAAQADPFYGYV